MQPHNRLVTELPLSELWTDDGPLKAERKRSLDRESLRQLLQRAAVRFVVANPGHPLRYVPEAEAYVFWKMEVRPHLVNEPDRPFNVYHYPEGYCYLASEWQPEDRAYSMVVLESQH